MGMEGHNHAMMITDFKKRFYVVLILTILIVLLSTIIQKFIGVDWQFTGSEYILIAFSDVYYGMAENRIGVACLDLPDFLPHEGVADPPEAKV